MINKSALVQELEKGSTIKLVFQSLNSGDLIDIICSVPSSILKQNADSNKLVVWRQDEERFEDIVWSSIRHWNI